MPGWLGTLDVTMLVIVAFAASVLVAGLVERRSHRRHVAAVPLRINVNGTRGKSTVVRLVTGMLAEAGRTVVGKTTGSEARLVFGFDPSEQPIKRRPEGPNIREQKVVMRDVARHGADVFVSECMAVVPEYQEIFQTEMLQANVAVITNVLEDHLREMGPTTDEVAESFAATIPYDGLLVTPKGPYLDFFRDIAEERGTDVLVADPSRVAPADLANFAHLVFPEHVALALTLADALAIDEDVALAGMRRAQPDPFATRILPIGSPASPSYFVNAFAANDPASTLGVWRHLRDLGHTDEGLVVVMNCRADRWDRSEQFARDVLPALPAQTLVVIGELAAPVLRAREAGVIDVPELLDLQERDPAEVHATVRGLLRDDIPGQVVYGVGNVHRAAIPLIGAFERDAAAARHDGADSPRPVDRRSQPDGDSPAERNGDARAQRNSDASAQRNSDARAQRQEAEADVRD